MQETLAHSGFEIVPSVLSTAEVHELLAALEALEISPGHRQLMRRVPLIRAQAKSDKILALLRERVGKPCLPVRSIFFDKTPEANWLVPWHQDLTIAVKERREISGFGPWSVKGGTPHVQPPIALLENMVTLRLHLDDCDEASGALRVIPGSHLGDRLGSAKIAEMRAAHTEVVCPARAGDALLMRPLLLHASSVARSASHRRVIHIEYATSPLPHGLEWAEAY